MIRSQPAADHLQPLRRLQQSLQEVYRLEVRHDIGEFLTTDADALASLGVDLADDTEETVFVHTDDDAIAISVYIHPQTLARLAGTDGTYEGTGLHDYCIAAEGVSHFVFIVERAGQSRQTSAFELELQAEVDKFLLLTGVVDASAAPVVDDVHGRLFDAIVLRKGLDATAALRYSDANRYAARYCRWLQRLARTAPSTSVRQELCNFYHLPLAEKIQRIEMRPCD